MNKTWSVYDPKTGAFTGKYISGPDSVEFIEANTPKGMSAIEGRWDHLRTEVVIDEHGAVAVDRDVPLVRPTTPADVMRQIQALEGQQLRPLRELMLDPNDATARSKLNEINDQVAGLRDELAVAKDAVIASAATRQR
jgi:hypothetical protein